MELVDTHCHLDVEAFAPGREAVLQRARAAGVTHFVVPAIDADHWDSVIRLREKETGISIALGMHPVFMERHSPSHLQALADLVPVARPVAIGEIGLDYFIEHADRKAQSELLSAQLDIAADSKLPVILHVRKAHDDVLALLRKHPVKGGIVHAFNGSLQQADKYLAMGFKLGFGGMLTYQRSRKIRALAKTLPLEALVLETDAPDMTVASHHGGRNSPEYLPECLQALAEVRKEPVEILAQQSTANACQVLGLNLTHE
jgi:TatD DNase family protein